jgi:hypothetical protein
MHRSYSLTLGALVAVLTLAACDTEASDLTRLPYLQRVGPDTATVAFRLDSSCTASVRYGTGGVVEQEALSSDSGRTHAIVLTGLQPDTEYTYTVDACGTRTEPRRFSTAPSPGTRRVRFATVGDFGTGGKEQRAVAQAILGRRPELFLALGDTAYTAGTEEEIQERLFAPMGRLFEEVPLFAVPGNHEYVTQQAQPYLDNLYLPTSPSGGERYYSFDWGHVHFVAVDSSCLIGLASADRCTPEAQQQWLEQDLSASQAPWKIVFLHHPPWSSGEHGSSLEVRHQLAPLFERYGVDLVLAGHDHHYERTWSLSGEDLARSGARGVFYLVVGNGGARLRGFPGSTPSWSAVRNNRDYGFLDVEVVEGTLTARMVTTSGKVADSFTLTKELPPTVEPAPTPALPQPAPPATLAPSPASPEPTAGEPGPEGLGGCSTSRGALLFPAAALVLAAALLRRRRAP